MEAQDGAGSRFEEMLEISGQWRRTFGWFVIGGLARQALNLALICMVLTLASCTASKGRFKVQMATNRSGLECSSFSFREAHNLLGNLNESPDVPPGMYALVKRVHPIQTRGTRYTCTASGGISVISLKESNRFPRSTKAAATLREMMEPGSKKAPDYYKVPEIPWSNAAQVFHGKIQVHEFPWGRGVLFLTEYVQGPTSCLINNDMLVPTLQRLSNDGRMAISAHLPVRHRQLPDTMDGKPGGAYQSFEMGSEKDSVAAEAWIDQQPDDSFQPSITSCIELLEHLQIGKH